MKPVKVLLIDDDEDDYIVTKAIFNEIPHKQRYQLSWVNNYEEAINAMLKRHYDIYLVDYRMGKFTGLDLLNEAIKSNVKEPIIILTGKGDEKVDNSALETGAADYLIKDQINAYTIERSIRYAIKHNHTLKALKESENKFRIIFEKSKEPFLILDSKGFIADINQAGLNFLNYNRVEIEKIENSSLFLDYNQYAIFEQEIEDKGYINDYETEIITKDNNVKSVVISAFLQIDQHATETLYHCIVHDVTNRNKEKASLVLTEKNETKEQIALNLAGEIRNPLSNINLALEQLEVDLNTEDETLNFYLDIIKSNFEKINNLVLDLGNNHKKESDFSFVVLNTVLEDCCNRLSINSRINIKENWSNEEVMIYVDEQKFTLAIDKLLRYVSKTGKQNLNVKTYASNYQVFIEIESEVSSFEDGIFEDKDFISLDNSNRSKEDLYSARLVIEENKGIINIDESLKKGTKVAITLPLSNNILFL
jgi:PAS domain S-box-containing protein